jgi:RNA polymerase sigma factor (sigma-70 family)
MREADHTRTERFDALFSAYARDIAAYCRWRAGSPHDAEDALSEVFLTAWRRLDDVPTDDAARIWLYATARRVMANQWRAARRRAGLHERLFSAHEPAIADLPADDPAIELVHAALRRLKPIDQEVLLLSEWEELSSPEIAQVLGCTPVSARGRLHRARKRFREVWLQLPRPASDSFAEEPDPLPPVRGIRPLRLAEDPSLDRLAP